MELKPEEHLLIGQWIERKGGIVGDEACERIGVLTEKYLQKIGTDKSGWITIYKDPRDGKYWKLDYPHSAWQGGGPPSLECISEEDFKKYFLHLKG